MARDTRTGPKDILVEYLTKGIKGVKRLHEDKGPFTRRTMRDAMKMLEERGSDFVDLEDWCKKTQGYGLNNRGSAHGPKTGEERTYKAQGKLGAPYMKLPLRTLGIKPGQPVKTAFLEGKLITTA